VPRNRKTGVWPRQRQAGGMEQQPQAQSLAVEQNTVRLTVKSSHCRTHHCVRKILSSAVGSPFHDTHRQCAGLGARWFWARAQGQCPRRNRCNREHQAQFSFFKHSVRVGIIGILGIYPRDVLVSFCPFCWAALETHACSLIRTA
jgi:hypothetical protein